MDEPKTFTTMDLISKTNETLRLASEIMASSVAKNPKISQLIKLQSENVLRVLSKLNNPSDEEARIGRNLERPSLMNSERMNLVAEINDSLVDKTIYYMDQVKNVAEGKGDLIEVQLDISKANSNKTPVIKINDFNGRHNSSTPPGRGSTIGSKRKHPDTPGGTPIARKAIFLTQANVRRPQISYNLKVDNNYSTPFIPKLTRKPNALVLFEESIKPLAVEAMAEKCLCTFPNHYYPHPYQTEIERFEVPLEFLDEVTEEPTRPWLPEERPYRLITKRDDLASLVTTLKHYKEVAIDLEHHSFRTYQGITCLIQISTDDEDFVVDVFPLWSEMEALNEVFTDPAILKVFHGSDFDMIWLQRDLGLYVVNMFDTGLAARQLGLPHFSLSYLISKYCDVEIDKRFQLADWRIRPLPEDMLQYARLDTHYLLYIYRLIKRDLLKAGDGSANLLRVVCQKSKELALKRYEKRLLMANDHIHLTWKHKLRFGSRQLAALKSLYQWRDVIARNEDESPGYILPSTLMLKIAEVLPREQQGILACCSPIPPMVRQYINDIHRLVLEARSKAAVDEVTNSSIQFDRVQRNESSIDLSHDRLIDQHAQKVEATTKQEAVPSLVWNAERGVFEANRDKKMEVQGRNVENQKDRKTSTKLVTMANLFVANVARFIEEEIERRQVANKIDKFFDDYVSPYQRYLAAIGKKKSEAKAEFN